MKLSAQILISLLAWGMFVLGGLLISDGPGLSELGIRVFPFLIIVWIATFIGKKKNKSKVYRIISIILSGIHAVLFTICLFKYPSARENRLKAERAEQKMMNGLMREIEKKQNQKNN